MSLLIQAKNYARKEREATVALLETLVEIEETKVHLRAGYRNLFHFLTTGLLYSDGSSGKLLRATRALSKFPALRPLLLSRELSLSTLSLISDTLTEENYETLICEVKGKSKREVELILLRLKAPEKLSPAKERVQPIAVSAPKRVPVEETPLFQSNVKQSARIYSPGKAAVPLEQEPFKQKMRSKLKLTFSVEERVGALMEEAKALLSNRYPTGASMEELFEEGLKAIIAEEKRKRASRGTRRAKALQSVTRHIPAKVKAEVLERDRYCCSWKGEGGKSCGSKWGLELDHVKPFSMGGKHTPDNLRVLCRAHHKMVTDSQFS